MPLFFCDWRSPVRPLASGCEIQAVKRNGNRVVVDAADILCHDQKNAQNYNLCAILRETQQVLPFKVSDRVGAADCEFDSACGIQCRLVHDEITALAMLADAAALCAGREDNPTDNLGSRGRGALRGHSVAVIARPVAHRDCGDRSGDFNLILGGASLAKASRVH